MFQRFSFFKQPAHRVFDYQPRYYDERKERIQRRIEEEERRQKGTAPDREQLERKIRFKNDLQSRWSPSYRKHARNSNLRLIVILGVLLGIFYFLFLEAETLSRWFTST